MLETAQTEVTLLEDTVSRVLDQLQGVDQELSALDSKQATKKMELRKIEEELTTSKWRIGEAQRKLTELTEKDGALAKKNIRLLVRGGGAPPLRFLCTTGVPRLASQIPLPLPFADPG